MTRRRVANLEIIFYFLWFIWGYEVMRSVLSFYGRGVFVCEKGAKWGRCGEARQRDKDEEMKPMGSVSRSQL